MTESGEVVLRLPSDRKEYRVLKHQLRSGQVPKDQAKQAKKLLKEYKRLHPEEWDDDDKEDDAGEQEGAKAKDSGKHRRHHKQKETESSATADGAQAGASETHGEESSKKSHRGKRQHREEHTFEKPAPRPPKEKRQKRTVNEAVTEQSSVAEAPHQSEVATEADPFDSLSMVVGDTESLLLRTDVGSTIGHTVGSQLHFTGTSEFGGGGLPDSATNRLEPEEIEPHEVPEHDMQMQGSMDVETSWKGLLEHMKKPRGKDIPTEELEAYSHALINKMIEADAEDAVALRENRPGVAKLRILPEVKRALSKAYLHESLVQQKLLTVLSDWLSPIKLPGQNKASLPNFDIRSALLDALMILPLQHDPGRLRKLDDAAWEGIGKEDLQGTPIGRRVHFIANHPDETKDNKDKAEQLIERWSRLFFEVSRDYKRLADAEAQRGRHHEQLHVEEWQDSLATLPAETIHSQNPETELAARRERYKRRVRIPQRQLMDFHYRPQSQFTAEELKQRQGTVSGDEFLRNNLKRRAHEIKLGNKIGARISRMSVEGSMSTMPPDAIHM